MLPDLERLIHLQELDTRAREAARIVATAPERIAALDERLSAAHAAVDAAKSAIADNQAARRTADRDLSAAQQRLEKYKEQSMAVKTNAEFHAMQHQMAAVKTEIDQVESRMLEIMVQADEQSTALKAAEGRLKTDEANVAAERRAIEDERAAREAVVAACRAEREATVASMDARLVALFDKVAGSRGGIAVARAEKERCVICQVRLRPMVFNSVKRNDQIVQCDSCQRILYFVPPRADADPASSDVAAPPAR